MRGAPDRSSIHPYRLHPHALQFSDLVDQLIRFAYRRPGRGDPIVYDQRLVADRPDVKVLLQESYGGRDLTVGDAHILPRGAPVIWYVFPGQWHDVGAFHLHDGTLTGWYANICTPVEIDGNNWSSTDLFLDLWMPVGSHPVWLDEDEFQSAVDAGTISDEMTARALEERTRLEAEVRAGGWPPEVVREVDLKTVRGATPRHPPPE